MSDPRLDSMESSISELRSGQAAIRVELKDIRSEMGGLRTSVDGLRTDVDGLRTDVDGLRTSVDGLRTDVDGLRTDVDALRTDMQDHHNQVLVLFEQVKDQIVALAPDFVPIRREFRAADADLEQRIDDRLVPVETWVRERSRQGRPRRRR
jgi:outer membrane murein-binding lipoprotein Lpp